MSRRSSTRPACLSRSWKARPSFRSTPELRTPTKGYPQGVLNKIVTLLPEKVILFLTVYQDFDVVASVMSESSGQ